MKPRLRACLSIALALVLAGCKSVGPGSVASDRFDYGSAVSDSWKRATLYNLVKLRYMDMPLFIEIGQIVAGYSVETGSTLNAQAGTGLPNPGTLNVGVGGSIRYTDRPTITYVPMTGGRFLKGLMVPLTLESVFFLVESGMPADAVLLLTGASLSGLPNQVGARPPSQAYLRVLELLRQLQASDGVSIRVVQDAAKINTTLLSIHPTPDATTAELRQLLRLDPQAAEVTLSYGVVGSPRDVALKTRSLLQIMQVIASQIEVPQEDVTDGRAAPGLSDARSELPANQRLLRIRSSKEPPTDAMVAVQYRGRYFFIDDRDLKSKQYFSYLMLLFTLIDPSKDQPLPILTIPTQ